jgi:hypothetical protein
LVATGRWPDEAAAARSDGRADCLDLNCAKGFKDTDLAFIEDWPLQRLSLRARTSTGATLTLLCLIMRGNPNLRTPLSRRHTMRWLKQSERRGVRS